MRHEPVRLLNQRSPKSFRRERQARQRSGCCCCLLVVISLLIALIALRGAAGAWLSGVGRDRPDKKPAAFYPLELQVSQDSYYRYGLVQLTATLVDPDGAPVTGEDDLLVTVTREGTPVTTIGNVAQVRLKYDRNLQKYTAYWPVPWNCEPGVYVAETQIEIEEPEKWPWYDPQERRGSGDGEQEPEIAGKAWCQARTGFEVIAAPRPDFPVGTSIATWEPDFRADGIPRPEGGTGDWRTKLDWCEYVGADSFWFRGAVTETYQGTLTMEEPFKGHNLEAVPRLGAEAHRRGIKFGVWAVAYSTYPKASNERKPEYDYAKDISRSTGKVSELEFVSLLDDRRIDHLAQFAADMQALPEVDYIGFDYFRTDRGGYEMVDRFASECRCACPQTGTT